MKQALLILALGLLVHFGYSQGDGTGSEKDSITVTQELVTGGDSNSSQATLQRVPGLKEGLYFSRVYPNPADLEATLDYQLKPGVPLVRFVLFNFLGVKEQEIEITENSGSLRLNTSGLTEGIYFYSLLIDNESVLTQKLIIKH